MGDLPNGEYAVYRASLNVKFPGSAKTPDQNQHYSVAVKLREGKEDGLQVYVQHEIMGTSPRGWEKIGTEELTKTFSPITAIYGACAQKLALQANSDATGAKVKKIELKGRFICSGGKLERANVIQESWEAAGARKDTLKH